MASKIFICTLCGYMGKAKNQVKGSFAIELLLWLFFIIPGLIYSAWRSSSRQKVCPQCGNTTLIPTDSPVGQKMLLERKEVSSSQNQQKIVQ